MGLEIDHVGVLNRGISESGKFMMDKNIEIRRCMT